MDLGAWQDVAEQERQDSEQGQEKMINYRLSIQSKSYFGTSDLQRNYTFKVLETKQQLIL
jgi:hypothetical protein